MTGGPTAWRTGGPARGCGVFFSERRSLLLHGLQPRGGNERAAEQSGRRVK